MRRALVFPSRSPLNIQVSSQPRTSLLESARASSQLTNKSGPYWLSMGSQAPSFKGSWHSFFACSNCSRMFSAGTIRCPRGVLRINCGSIGPKERVLAKHDFVSGAGDHCCGGHRQLRNDNADVGELRAEVKDQ